MQDKQFVLIMFKHIYKIFIQQKSPTIDADLSKCFYSENKVDKIPLSPSQMEKFKNLFETFL